MTAYVSPWQDEELELYRDTVRRSIKAEIVPNQEKWRQQRPVGREIWSKAGELEFPLADIPDEYGGAGETFANMAVCWKELTAAGDTGSGTHAHTVAAQYIHRHGTEEQKKTCLPKLAQGKTLAAIAVTESGAGSDVQNVRTASKRSNDHLLNGSKTFISNGYLADLTMVVAKTDPSAGLKGISRFLVEAHKVQGLRVGPSLETIGRKGHDICEVFFDDVLVPESPLLGEA